MRLLKCKTGFQWDPRVKVVILRDYMKRSKNNFLGFHKKRGNLVGLHKWISGLGLVTKKKRQILSQWDGGWAENLKISYKTNFRPRKRKKKQSLRQNKWEQISGSKSEFEAKSAGGGGIFVCLVETKNV